VSLDRGELVRLAYKLGKQQATGVLAIHAGSSATRHDNARPELFVLRRGHVVVPEGELARRALGFRLTRLAPRDDLRASFEAGVPAYPPGSQHLVSLAGWARQHLEQQLDNSLAEQLVRELAGMRLSIRSELLPEPTDDADRRMLTAMTQPRRLDQIWPLARTPRFRLLAFIHFLRAVDALEVDGVVAERSAPYRMRPRGTEAPGGFVVDTNATVDRVRRARRVLGVEADADLDSVKRAYRRLARAFHPDLHPDLDVDARRLLERRFAEVNAAYQALL